MMVVSRLTSILSCSCDRKLSSSVFSSRRNMDRHKWSTSFNSNSGTAIGKQGHSKGRILVQRDTIVNCDSNSKVRKRKIMKTFQ